MYILESLFTYDCGMVNSYDVERSVLWHIRCCAWRAVHFISYIQQHPTYCILYSENFWGEKFREILKNLNFCRNKFACVTLPSIYKHKEVKCSQEIFLQMAIYLQNARKFSPTKIFCIWYIGCHMGSRHLCITLQSDAALDNGYVACTVLIGYSCSCIRWRGVWACVDSGFAAFTTELPVNNILGMHGDTSY